MTRFKSCCWLGAVVTAIALFTTADAGQPPRPAAPPDILDPAKNNQQLVDQKAEAALNEVLSLADQQGRTNRESAVRTLKTAKQNLQIAISISEATRTRLTNKVDAKLAAFEGKAVATPGANLNGGAKPNPGVKLDPKGPEALAAQKLLIEKASAEYKDVVTGIKTANNAIDLGKTAEANAEIARLTKLYPNNPSVIALGQGDSMRNRIGDAMAYTVLARDRWVKNQININKSSLPAVMDYELPADWKEKSERRLRANTVQMSAKEKKIIEALDKPIDVDFRERPFEEALQDLSNKIDQPLLLDRKSISDLDLDLKKGANLQANGLSGRTVLRAILAAQGLTFVVKDETIQVVTVERARSILTTRVYYLGDIVQFTGPFGGIQWGPNLNAQQAVANADELVNMIRKSIDPLSWNGQTGGPGSITFHYPSMSIIVRASAEVHYTLGRTFGSGK